jgi:glutamate 5-kinase
MLTTAKRIVIKIGSSLIIGEDNLERRDWILTLVSDIAKLKRDGKEIIVVSSGAVALGRNVLGYGTKKLSLEEKQAAAACGQSSLMALWAEYLGNVGIYLYPAQMLLTADDISSKTRAKNASNTLETLLKNPRIVPVINENDTVATEELRVGDNDSLAAHVAQMANADLLIIFSDIDGLYSEDPRNNPNAKFQKKISEITPEIEAMAGGTGSLVGTGGMTTKIIAAKIATSAGCNMIIAKGTENHPLKTLMDGGKSTLFLAKENK